MTMSTDLNKFLSPTQSVSNEITDDYLRSLPDIHPTLPFEYIQDMDLTPVAHAFNSAYWVTATLADSVSDALPVLTEAAHAALVVANVAAKGRPVGDDCERDMVANRAFISPSLMDPRVIRRAATDQYAPSIGVQFIGRLEIATSGRRGPVWDYEYARGIVTAANAILAMPWALDKLSEFRRWVVGQAREATGFSGLLRSSAIIQSMRLMRDVGARNKVDAWVAQNIYNQDDAHVHAWRCVTQLPMVHLEHNIEQLHSLSAHRTGHTRIMGGLPTQGDRWWRTSDHGWQSSEAQETAVKFIALALDLVKSMGGNPKLDTRAQLLMVVNESLRHGASLVASLESWYLSVAFSVGRRVFVSEDGSRHDLLSPVVTPRRNIGGSHCAGPLKSIVNLQRMSPLFWYKRRHTSVPATATDPRTTTTQTVTGVITTGCGLEVVVTTDPHRIEWMIENVARAGDEPMFVMSPKPIMYTAITQPRREVAAYDSNFYGAIIRDNVVSEVLAMRLLGLHARGLDTARLKYLAAYLMPRQRIGANGNLTYEALNRTFTDVFLRSDFVDLMGVSVTLRFPRFTDDTEVRFLYSPSARRLASSAQRPKVYVQAGVGGYHSSKEMILANKHGDGPMLGYELEITQESTIDDRTLSESADPAIIVARRLRDLAMRYAYAENDRSIGENGVEIVSSPARLATHVALLDKFDNDGPMRGVLPNDRCGLHVHVERAYLGSSNRMWAFYLFWNYGWCMPSMFHDTVMAPVNTDRRTRIASMLNFRTNNSYAQLMDIRLLRKRYEAYPKNSGSLEGKDAQSVGIYVMRNNEYSRGSRRYGAVNMEPSTSGATIEIRAFDGATSTNEIRQALSWVSASAEYIAAACGPEDKMAYRKLGMRGLCSFILQNRERFKSIADAAGTISMMFVTKTTDLINIVNKPNVPSLSPYVSLDKIAKMYTAPTAQVSSTCGSLAVTLGGATVSSDPVGFFSLPPLHRDAGGAVLGRDGSGNYVVTNPYVDTCTIDPIDFSQVSCGPPHEVTVTSNPPPLDASHVWSSRND